MRPSSGALDVEVLAAYGFLHRVFGWAVVYTVALKTTAHPKNRCRKPYAASNSTSNAPDDGRMYPKHVELRIHQ